MTYHLLLGLDEHGLGRIELGRRLRWRQLLQDQRWGIAELVFGGSNQRSSGGYGELYFGYGYYRLADNIDVRLIAVCLVVDAAQRSLLVQEAFYGKNE